MRGFAKTALFYVAWEYLISFLVAFLFFFFIFFLNHIILMAEEILSKQVPLVSVIKLLVYSLPSVMGFSLPFGALVGALMAVGKLSGDNEVLALHASGINLGKIFLPFIFLGGVFTSATFVLDDYLVPLSTIKFTSLYREILLSNPELELEPYSIKHYRDSTLITGSIDGGTFNGIVIIDEDGSKNRRIIVAEKATLVEGKATSGIISLTLESVVIHTPQQRIRGEFDYAFSTSMIYNILLKDISSAIQNPGPREMSTRDIYAIVLKKRMEQLDSEVEHRRFVQETIHRNFLTYLSAAKTAPIPVSSDIMKTLNKQAVDLEAIKTEDLRLRSLQLYELEFQRKFSLAFACISFVIFAFPVGLFSKRSGRSVGFGLGVLISILYYGILFAGQTLGYQNFLSPIVSMWSPNILIFFVGVILFIRRINK